MGEKTQPLLIAVRERDLDQVRELIAAGADINEQDENGNTPLTLAANVALTFVKENRELEFASQAHHDDERAKPNELSLILANGVYADKAIEIFTLLVEKGANINTRNEDSQSALFFAIECWGSTHPHLPIMLVTRGADVVTPDQTGLTVLMLAVPGSLELVKLLIERGADPNSEAGDTSALSKALEVDGVPEAIAFLLPLTSPEIVYKCCVSQLNLSVKYMLLKQIRVKDLERYSWVDVEADFLFPGEATFYGTDSPGSPEHVGEIDMTTSWMYHTIRFVKALFGETTEEWYSVQKCSLPVLYATHTELLEVWVTVSEDLNKAELFDNEFIQYAVASAWRTYGSGYHTRLSLLYILLLALVTFTNYSFNSWIVSGNVAMVVAMQVSLAIICGVNSIFVLIELYQMMHLYQRGRVLSYLTDAQNAVDLGAHALVYLVQIIRWSNSAEDKNSAAVMAIGNIFLWLKLLYFLRPYKSTGPLIRTIFFIFFSIRELVGILIITIFGFSQSLYLLSYEDSSVIFSDPLDGIMNMYVYMLGAININQLYDTSNPALAQFLVSLFVFASSILLLNLLIALMGSSFNTIKAKENAEWVRGCARIMMEQWRPWGLKTKKYEYLIMRADDFDNKIFTSSKLPENRLGRIERNVSELNAKISGLEKNIEVILQLLQKTK